MIIDHIGIDVKDLEKSKAFYKKTLAPLGIELVAEFEKFVGFGREKKPEFWIAAGTSTKPPIHVAFLAPNRSKVDAFFAAGLSAGGKENGLPGIREIYHPNYYGAFILDPDGNNIEAVCHHPE